MKNHKKIEFHRLANIFPMIDEISFSALKNDIKQNGLLQPILLFKNKIVDGRNRYNACLDVGIEPKFINYEGTEKDLFDYVLSLNLQRRHLTTTQKACLSVEILPEIEDQIKQNKAKKISDIRTNKIEVSANLQKSKISSSKIVGEKFGVSERYVNEAKKIFKENIELFEKMKSGEITLQKALKKLSKDTQVTPDLQKDKVDTNTTKLTKRDLKQVFELMKEFNISENKAIDYVLKKRLEKRKNNENNSVNAKEKKSYIKILLTPEIKETIRLNAESKNISMSKLVLESMIDKKKSIYL